MEGQRLEIDKKKPVSRVSREVVKTREVQKKTYGSREDEESREQRTSPWTRRAFAVDSSRTLPWTRETLLMEVARVVDWKRRSECHQTCQTDLLVKVARVVDDKGRRGVSLGFVSAAPGREATTGASLVVEELGRATMPQWGENIWTFPFCLALKF